MQALKLDYRQRDTWLQKAGWAGLLIACLILGLQGWQYRQLALGIGASKTELARLNAQMQLKQGGKDARRGNPLETEIGYAREVLLQMDAPWQDLLDAVEESSSEDISLLGIEPDPKQKEVRIIGEAKDYPAVLDYIRHLEASVPLAGVHLQHHQIQSQDPEHPVHFILGAEWRGVK